MQRIRSISDFHDISGLNTPYYACGVLKENDECTLSFCNDIAVEYIVEHYNANKKISLVFANVADFDEDHVTDVMHKFEVSDMKTHMENILENIKNMTQYSFEYEVVKCIICDHYDNELPGVVVHFENKHAFQYSTFWYALLKLIRICYIPSEPKTLEEYYEEFLSFNYADQKLLKNYIKNNKENKGKYLFLLEHTFNFLEKLDPEIVLKLRAENLIDVHGFFGSYFYLRKPFHDLKILFNEHSGIRIS